MNERYNFVNTENWQRRGLEELNYYEKTVLLDLLIKDISNAEG